MEDPERWESYLTEVVSNGIMNNGPGELVAVVPVTSTDYGLRSHVEIKTGRSGPDHASYARCDQVRVISTRRTGYRDGELSLQEMGAIDLTLRFIPDR